MRMGVGHLEDARDAAQHRAMRAGLQIFLVGQPGLAEALRIAGVDVVDDDRVQPYVGFAVGHFGQ